VVPVTDHPAPLTALLDGTLLPPEAPLLRPDDLGVLRGEGVFETTLVVDGIARDLDDHLARLAISAEMTGLVVPAPDRWRTGVDALVEAWTGDSQMVLRLVVSRGPESAVEPAGRPTVPRQPPAAHRRRSSVVAGQGVHREDGGGCAVAVGRGQDPVVRAEHGRAAVRRRQ
jgi:4-amino-4-deoxychorismate lyase